VNAPCPRRHALIDKAPRSRRGLGAPTLEQANRFEASVASRSRYPDSGLAVALAIYLGIYVGLAVCFAAGLYWLMQPSVFPNAGLAAYKPPPSTIVTNASSPRARTPPPLPAPTFTVAVVESEVVERPVVAPKTEAKKQHQAGASPRARRPRPERPEPMRDYAYQPSYGRQSYGFRP
jgi:hypothetical protein